MNETFSIVTRPLKPFYEELASLPPPIILLTAQTPLDYYLPVSRRLLAQESFTAHRLPGQNRRPSRASSRAPYQKPIGYTARFSAQARDYEPSDKVEEGEDELDDDEDDDSRTDSSTSTEMIIGFGHQSMIPKPAGEPGRPGAGGYSLSAALAEEGWDEGSLNNLKVASSISLSLAYISSGIDIGIQLHFEKPG